MRIVVDGVEHNVGYALWQLNKLAGETDREFLKRAQDIDNTMRTQDEARTAKPWEKQVLAYWHKHGDFFNCNYI